MNCLFRFLGLWQADEEKNEMIISGVNIEKYIATPIVPVLKMTRMENGEGARLAAKDYIDFIGTEGANERNIDFIDGGGGDKRINEIPIEILDGPPIVLGSPVAESQPKWWLAKIIGKVFYTASVGALLTYSTGYFLYKMIALGEWRPYIASFIFSAIVPISYSLSLCALRPPQFAPVGLVALIIASSTLANIASLIVYLTVRGSGDLPFAFLPLILLEWIYSRTLMATVIIIFFYVFLGHYEEIRELAIELRDGDVWNADDKNAIGALVHRVVEIKARLGKSIRGLQPIYLFATILGSVGLGLMIETAHTTLYNITFCVLYILVQFVFLSIIYGVSAKKQAVIDIVSSPAFSMKYILRNYKHNEKCSGVSVADQLSQSGFLPSSRASTPVAVAVAAAADSGHVGNSDWIMLNSILAEKWSDFTFLGISFNDGSGIKKIIAATLAIITLFSNLDKYTALLPTFGLVN